MRRPLSNLVGKCVADIGMGAASPDETERFDTDTLMGRPPSWEA